MVGNLKETTNPHYISKDRLKCKYSFSWILPVLVFLPLTLHVNILTEVEVIPQIWYDLLCIEKTNMHQSE